MSVNKVILLGYVGRNPDFKAFQNGGECAIFSLATSESYKDKNSGEKITKTEWHHVVVYNQNIVHVVKDYVKKGSKLYIEGSIHTREYEGKGGVKKQATEVILQENNSVLLLEGKASEKEEEQSPSMFYEN